MKIPIGFVTELAELILKNHMEEEKQMASEF